MLRSPHVANAMNLCSIRVGIVAVGMLFSVSAAAQPRSALPVYDSTQIALDRYTVIKRLGVQGWRSGYYIPSYADAASAVQAVLEEAARLGADGVVNLYCLNRSDRFRGEGHYCYANAIKLKE
jgi:uncharacterized protein YbjQ (UPF0145 family)